MGNGTDFGTGIGRKWERYNMKTIIFNDKREKQEYAGNGTKRPGEKKETFQED